MATKKASSNPDVWDHAKETIGAVNEITTKTALDKSKAALRTVAIRINEVDYNRLNALFAAQGTNMAAAGKAALFYLAEQIEAGTLSIPHGVIYRHR
jgi:hypothetical protein